MSHPIVHAEIRSADPDATRAFFGDLFGWTYPTEGVFPGYTFVETGVPGALMLLATMLAGVWAAWRRPDLTGRVAFGAMLILLMATSVNSALRDAQIGLSLLWVALLFLRLAGESGRPWADVLPHAGSRNGRG